MTWLRRLVATLCPLAMGRRAPVTIAEMRKAVFTSTVQRYRETQPADKAKLRGERAKGKVRNLAQWTQRHGRRSA